MAADVVNLSSADTVLGQPVSISVSDGNVMVDNANVIITDIEGTNGVIHVIDAVLVPGAEEMAASSVRTKNYRKCWPFSTNTPNPCAGC